MNTTIKKDSEIARKIITEIQKENNLSSQQLLQAAMDIFMIAERDLHLSDNNEDKGNGYFSRKLGTPLGELNLQIPRDRDGDFRSQILPKPHYRDTQERYELLQTLMLNGYSPNTIKRTLEQLNLHYNPNELKELKENYLELYQQWQVRQLPSDVIALFVDAYHCNTLINNQIRKTVLYVIIGIDFEGKKDLFGIYLYDGSESSSFWLQTLNKLIDRGIKCPLMIVSDDFPGLKQSVNTLFPNTLHQLCFIHMQRNVRRQMQAQDAKDFNNQLSKIKLEQNVNICQNKFLHLCKKYQNKYPHFVSALSDDVTNYFAFKHLPETVQKHFYTTNIVESVNSIIESLRYRMGGFFQSEEALFVNVFLIIQSLQKRKWRKGMPLLQGYLYEIRQLFAQRFNRPPNSNN